MTRHKIICPRVVRSEVFRAASIESPHRNAGVIRQARGCTKPKKRWGAVSTRRHQSHSAGYFRPLGYDEDVLPIHDQVGRSKKAITRGHRTSARNSGLPEGERKKQALAYKTKLKSRLLGKPFQLTDMCLTHSGPGTGLD